MRDNFEFHAEIDAIIETLESAGQREAGRRLRDAMAVSTLPGEILGETHLELKRLRKYPALKQSGIASRIESAIDYVNSILGKHG